MKGLGSLLIAIILTTSVLAGCGQAEETIDLTILASMAGDLSEFNEKEYLAENQGIKKATVMEDGSLALTMTKEKQAEIVSQLEQELRNTLANLIEAPHAPYIKNVEHSDNFKQVKLSVDKNEFEGAYDLTPVLIALSVGTYQTYAGESPSIKITLHDHETGEEMDSVQYPQ